MTRREIKGRLYQNRKVHMIGRHNPPPLQALAFAPLSLQLMIYTTTVTESLQSDRYTQHDALDHAIDVAGAVSDSTKIELPRENFVKSTSHKSPEGRASEARLEMKHVSMASGAD